MKVTHNENTDGSLEITLSFTVSEVNYLKHDLLGLLGVVDWYAKGPSSEKIYRCKESMEKEMIPKLRAKGVAIPATDAELQALIMKDPDYKDRQARDVETASPI